MQIQDTVWGRNPATLEEAKHLAATLTNNHVKAGTLTRKGEKKTVAKDTPQPAVEIETEASTNGRRKVRNFAIDATVPPNKKQYNGNQPKCDTCLYHHPTQVPCRHCTNCQRYGHLADACRIPATNALYAPNNPARDPPAT